MNTISGNTAQTDTKFTGNQAATAPTSETGNMRIIYGVGPGGSGGETAENSLSSQSASNDWQLTLLDTAVTIAKTATPLIRPLRVNGKPKYVVFMHPYQVHTMKTDATAARVTWYDTQRARVQGGEMDNPIYNGAYIN